MTTHRLWVIGTILPLCLAGCTNLSYQDRDDHPVQAEPLPGGSAPTLDQYRSPLTAEVLDRRFTARDAMYLASEMQLGSFDFFERAMLDGLIASDPDFQYITTVESYWYSRYNLSCLGAESRLGLHVVYGPYVTDWALRQGRANVNRDRGEYARSNKGVLLQEIIPLYLARTGFPRRFEDASPCMLQYASGDPHFVRPLDKGVSFQSTENLVRQKDLSKLYGEDLPPQASGMGIEGNDMWHYRINYRENFLSLRWNHDDMEHVIDMGAEGQTLMKQALWIEYFFRGSHHGGRFLGNDPEEGFRGAMLNLMAVSKMLMLKGAMLYDGKQLTGVDPRTAAAGAPGTYYFPHRIAVRLRYVGDLPPRPEQFSVLDDSSQLFDQASLLWGLSEYYHFADPTVENNWNWHKVFGDDLPYDGSIMQRQYVVLAEGLANLILQNIQAMHLRPEGTLVSQWRPDGGQGQAVSTTDLAMSMLALSNYARHVHTQPQLVQAATDLLKQQADFMIERLRGADGSVADGFDYAGQAALDGPRTLQAQAFAIRGWIEAYKILDDERYLDAAKDAYAYMNLELWDDQVGVYRSQAGTDVTIYTPLNLGAALGAVREITLATKDAGEIERFKRFWVQAVDHSGIQQSEYEETGERDFYKADGDGDGIPRMEYGDGKYGIAPVFASKVRIQTPQQPQLSRQPVSMP